MNGAPLKHDRDLSKFRDAYGIKDSEWAEAAQLRRGIQGVVQLDDASHLLQPIGVPYGIYDLNTAAAPAVFSGGHFAIFSPRGAFVTLSAGAAGHRATTINFAALLGPAALVPELDSFGIPFTTVAETGVLAAGPAGLLLPPFGNLVGPFYLSPGTTLQICQVVANTICACAVTIQEIP